MWLSALDQVAADTAQLMRAIWRALTPNERRVARALAILSGPLHSDETAAVGIKRTSVGRAVEALTEGKPRLTDPMFEYWLQTQGLTPPGADDEEEV